MYRRRQRRQRSGGGGIGVAVSDRSSDSGSDSDKDSDSDLGSGSGGDGRQAASWQRGGSHSSGDDSDGSRSSHGRSSGGSHSDSSGSGSDGESKGADSGDDSDDALLVTESSALPGLKPAQRKALAALPAAVRKQALNACCTDAFMRLKMYVGMYRFLAPYVDPGTGTLRAEVKTRRSKQTNLALAIGPDAFTSLRADLVSMDRGLRMAAVKLLFAVVYDHRANQRRAIGAGMQWVTANDVAIIVVSQAMQLDFQQHCEDRDLPATADSLNAFLSAQLTAAGVEPRNIQPTPPAASRRRRGKRSSKAAALRAAQQLAAAAAAVDPVPLFVALPPVQQSPYAGAPTVFPDPLRHTLGFPIATATLKAQAEAERADSMAAPPTTVVLAPSDQHRGFAASSGLSTMDPHGNEPVRMDSAAAAALETAKPVRVLQQQPPQVPPPEFYGQPGTATGYPAHRAAWQQPHPLPSASASASSPERARQAKAASRAAVRHELVKSIAGLQRALAVAERKIALIRATPGAASSAAAPASSRPRGAMPVWEPKMPHVSSRNELLQFLESRTHTLRHQLQAKAAELARIEPELAPVDNGLLGTTVVNMQEQKQQRKLLIQKKVAQNKKANAKAAQARRAKLKAAEARQEQLAQERLAKQAAARDAAQRASTDRRRLIQERAERQEQRTRRLYRKQSRKVERRAQKKLDADQRERERRQQEAKRRELVLRKRLDEYAKWEEEERTAHRQRLVARTSAPSPTAAEIRERAEAYSHLVSTWRSMGQPGSPPRQAFSSATPGTSNGSIQHTQVLVEHQSRHVTSAEDMSATLQFVKQRFGDLPRSLALTVAEQLAAAGGTMPTGAAASAGSSPRARPATAPHPGASHA